MPGDAVADASIATLGLQAVVPPTSYTTKQDFVASVLRAAIVSGKLAPGQRLRQEEVSRQLGLSWTPVREAFRLLEAEGWLTIERHRGAVVSPLSLEDFEDIYLLRLANEPLLARLSAERADDATLKALEQLAQRMQRLRPARTSDWLTFLQLEREFHRTYYQTAGRRRLYEVVMGLRDASERYLRASFAIASEPRQHQQVHAELLAAYRERAGEAAEAVMQRALERVLARMRPLLARVLQGQNGR